MYYGQDTYTVIEIRILLSRYNQVPRGLKTNETTNRITLIYVVQSSSETVNLMHAKIGPYNTFPLAVSTCSIFSMRCVCSNVYACVCIIETSHSRHAKSERTTFSPLSPSPASRPLHVRGLC